MDFQINDAGDLIMEETARSKQLELTFRVSDYPGIELSFHVLNEKQPVENKGLKITFDITKDSDLSQNVKVIREIDEKVQLMRIALMTELGELVNHAEFGSRLKLYKHKDIHSKKNLNAIKTAVTECIENIITEPSVRVVPQNGAGNLYFHYVAIYIYESKTQIFKFYI